MVYFYHRQTSRLVQISPFERFVPISVYNIMSPMAVLYV